MLSPLTATLAWIIFPLLVGFSIYLFPKLDQTLSMGVALASLLYGLWQIAQPGALSLKLLDSFGVNLLIDQLSGYFILTNAVVTAAVVLYCWQQNKNNFFYTQLTILHGSVNAIFICADLISLYVALEVTGIAAFLLITYSRTNQSIWVGLRYLFVSNTALLFYMIGALLVYQTNSSFDFSGLAQAPPEAIALIFLGLLSKGGIFISGLWLPLTHSEAETQVSAMLSGVVIKTGVFPLVRLSLLIDDLSLLIQLISVGTAVLGTSFAIAEKDTKRMLALSTISQMGFILAAPAVAGLYAFAHGVAKSALFLTVGKLPSRDFTVLKQTPIRLSMWIVITLAGLSLAGFPLLAGFNAKTLTLKPLVSWQGIALNTVTVGSAIAMSKLIFLPFYNDLKRDTPNNEDLEQKDLKHNFAPSPSPIKKSANKKSPEKSSPALPQNILWAVYLLIAILITASALHIQDYTATNLAKALGKVGLGVLIYQIFANKLPFKVSQAPEKLENLIGGMSLMLIVLFWIVVA
ncbi:MAG: cation:proton antiporter [Cyanobacteria bacterium J06621_11]